MNSKTPKINPIIRPPGDEGGSASASSSSFIGFADATISSAPLPEAIKAILGKENATRSELLQAAEVAGMSGFLKLADALRDRAKDSLIESPWADVPSPAWTRFCGVMAEGHAPSEISPKGFFGLFQLSVKRLADLSIMRAPESRTFKLPNGKVARAWQGTWVVPQAKFLGDPKLQYKIFLRSMELYRSVIAEKYQQVLRLPISKDNKPASLSGLLALAHTAGSEGMRKWLTDGHIRKRFSWVTDAYARANGIF